MNAITQRQSLPRAKALAFLRLSNVPLKPTEFKTRFRRITAEAIPWEVQSSAFERRWRSLGITLLYCPEEKCYLVVNR